MTISEDVKDVASKVVVALPPQLLGLLCINIVFVLGLLWFLHDISIARIDAVKEIFNKCTSVMVANRPNGA